MTFKEIELLAAKKEPLPDNSPLHEIMCYTCMKSLYTEHFNKLIDSKDAAKKKKIIRLQFEKSAQEKDNQILAYKEFQDNIKKSENARREILLKAKSTGVIDVILMASCISEMCGDVAFEKVVQKINRLK